MLWIIQVVVGLVILTSTILGVDGENDMGWFALVDINHKLYHQGKEALTLVTHAWSSNVISTPSPTNKVLVREIIPGSGAGSSSSTSTIKKDYTTTTTTIAPRTKIYEFLHATEEQVMVALHGPSFQQEGGALSNPLILFVEKNYKIQKNPAAPATTPYHETRRQSISTRWRSHPSAEYTAGGQYCRYAAGVGRVGFQAGSFSWGIDVLDSRTNYRDLAFCPGGNFQGDGSHVFILDTGIGTQTTMNFSNIFRDFDYYYDPFTYGSRPPTDDADGHGSHTAGLVASTIYGVSPNVYLHVYKVLDDLGYGSFSGLSAALNEIYNRNIHRATITMSLGTSSASSPSVSSIITSLISDRNMVFTIAAGNDAGNACNNFPSNVPGVVAVAASDVNNYKPGFSNYGPCVTIFAPGKDIISCGKSGNSAVIYSGTSMATPITGGVAALFRQANPSMSAQQIISQILYYSTSNTLINEGAGSPNKLVYFGVLVPQPGGGSGGSGAPNLVLSFGLILLIIIIISLMFE